MFVGNRRRWFAGGAAMAEGGNSCSEIDSLVRWRAEKTLNAFVGEVHA